MTPRERRLISDRRELEALASTGEIAFSCAGDPPTRYRIDFEVGGLALGSDGTLAVQMTHGCDVYLHRDYPRRPPVVTWRTPVFHPNLTPPERNGGVCLGSWSAAEGLADVVRRLRDMVAYRSLNPADALDPLAADWASLHNVRAGADVADLRRLPVPAVVVPGGG
jgi:ubiquitin-protein ligase